MKCLYLSYLFLIGCTGTMSVMGAQRQELVRHCQELIGQTQMLTSRLTEQLNNRETASVDHALSVVNIAAYLPELVRDSRDFLPMLTFINYQQRARTINNLGHEIVQLFTTENSLVGVEQAIICAQQERRLIVNLLNMLTQQTHV